MFAKNWYKITLSETRVPGGTLKIPEFLEFLLRVPSVLILEFLRAFAREYNSIDSFMFMSCGSYIWIKIDLTKCNHEDAFWRLGGGQNEGGRRFDGIRSARSRDEFTHCVSRGLICPRTWTFVLALWFPTKKKCILGSIIWLGCIHRHPEGRCSMSRYRGKVDDLTHSVREIVVEDTWHRAHVVSEVTTKNTNPILLKTQTVTTVLALFHHSMTCL